MSKILIIPDVHGRKFWRDYINEEFDNIIFLGDYLDPYDGEATQKEALKEFKDIVDFKNNNLEKVILLIGNHDCPYVFDAYGKALSYWCRHDYKRHNEIAKIFKDNLDKFQIAWECDNEKYGKVLFTHAGVNSDFKSICGLDANQINSFFLSEETNGVSNIVSLANVSFYRGGYGSFGSPVWADVREHINYPVTDVFQIFGHTYSKDSIIMENFAMLDVGNRCYVLDKNGITKLNTKENGN